MTTCYQLLASVVPDMPGVSARLTRRLGDTRWPTGPMDGIPGDCRRWTHRWIEWLAQPPAEPLVRCQRVGTPLGEARLMHFPGRGRMPLLLLHGWPTSFLAFHRVVDRLQEVASDVVLAVLPGFGAPAPRTGRMGVGSIAAVLAEAMSAVGIQRFVVHGQDWGSVIARTLARDFPQRVIGIHVSAGLTGFLADGQRCGGSWHGLRAFAEHGSGYLALQSRRPDALAVGLEDSPAGMLAWHLDKFELWQSRLGADFGLGPDFILANATLYWATRATSDSMRIYRDNREIPSAPRASAPTGVSVFGTGDFACRHVSAEMNNLVAWYEHAVGGHVASLDAPESFVADLGDFIDLMEERA